MVTDDLIEVELQDLENRIMELKLAGYRINEQMLAQYEILKAEYKETKNEDK
jgi:hypothetical protein